jgi:MoaA/NifB/PqqE/SkfB family radical SAM enzyme
VILTGGEPFLHKNLYDLIEYVDKTKSICTIFTNGEFLTDQAVTRLKEAGTFGVFVSLDHSNPRIHDSLRRRPGIFHMAIKGIQRCQDQGILTGISTYITKEKIKTGELDRMMDLGRKTGVVEVFLFDIIATGKLDDRREEILNTQDVNYIRKFREKYNSRPEYPRIIHQTMFTSIAYPCAAEGCPGGVAQMHVRGNGDITPCDFTPLSFGNIREKSLASIWKEMTESEIYSKSSPKCRMSDTKLWKIIHNFNNH